MSCGSVRARVAHGLACKGNVRACFQRNFALLAPGGPGLVVGEAQTEGLSWDEAMEWLAAEGCCGAVCNWYAAVEQSLPGSAVPQH
jgi:hypothetical protein